MSRRSFARSCGSEGHRWAAEQIRDGQPQGIISGDACATQAKSPGVTASATACVNWSAAIARLPPNLTAAFTSQFANKLRAVRSWSRRRARVFPEWAAGRNPIEPVRPPPPVACPVRISQAFCQMSQGVRPNATQARQDEDLSTADGQAADPSVHLRGQPAETSRLAKSNVRLRRKTGLAFAELRRESQSRSDTQGLTGLVCNRLLSSSR